MEMERALETQRTKLLRLLAGWLAVVEWVSLAPFVGELPCWLRAFLGGLLSRAEYAAQSLVLVSARVQARLGYGEFTHGPSEAFAYAELPLPEDVPPTMVLLQRMRALCALLEDLPRQGRRLLRRGIKRNASKCRTDPRSDDTEPFVMAKDNERCETPFTRRIERPPDKRSA